MTTCPNGLQCVAVSARTSPVVDAAEVAVKSASRIVVRWPSAVAIGSARRTVPTTVIPKSVKIRTTHGERGFRTGRVPRRK